MQSRLISVFQYSIRLTSISVSQSLSSQSACLTGFRSILLPGSSLAPAFSLSGLRISSCCWMTIVHLFPHTVVMRRRMEVLPSLRDHIASNSFGGFAVHAWFKSASFIAWLSLHCAHHNLLCPPDVIILHLVFLMFAPCRQIHNHSWFTGCTPPPLVH